MRKLGLDNYMAHTFKQVTLYKFLKPDIILILYK